MTTIARKEALMETIGSDPERRRRREGAAQKPPSELSAEERSELRSLRTAQRAFQIAHCKSCIHFNPKKGDFIEKRHPNDSKDCTWHWTDIAGECWNFRLRPKPWHEALASYCASRVEYRWRLIGRVASVITSIMRRFVRR